MAAVTVCSDFRAQENQVSHCFHCFPVYLPWSDETGCHDLVASWPAYRFLRRQVSLVKSYIGEGNSNPLQCSCLENPRDGKPGRLQFMGLHRVGHDWSNLAAAAKSLQMVTAAIKLRRLLLGRKVMMNIDSIFKSRDITLPTKVRLVKAMVFPVVMYGCENWTEILVCLL